MKKAILALFLLICTCFVVFGQNTNPIDLILLLNTSTNMSSSYENVNDYITGNFLSEFLRVGDTFHLITFSQQPKLEIARRIAGVGDLEIIIGRMLLQYPIESGNNTGLAISFAEQYITSLPDRPKKIVLVSTDSAGLNNLVSEAKQRLGSLNTTFDYVQVIPGQAITNAPVSGRPSAPGTRPSSTTSVTPSSPTASTQVPGTSSSEISTGSQGQAAAPGSTTGQGLSQTSGTVVDPSTAGTTDSAASGTSSSGTQDTTSGTQDATSGTQGTASGTQGTASGTQDTASGTQGTVSQTPSTGVQDRTSGTRTWASSLPLIIGIILLLLLILGLIIYFAARRLGSSPKRVMSSAASYSSDRREDAPFVDHSKDLAKYAAAQSKQRVTPYSDRSAKAEIVKPYVIPASGPLLLNLFVEDQNTAIGKRNIHSLKSGYSLSVGGGKSDFLIFLVPIPAGIGELRRNGSSLTFIPRKQKYFPDGAGEIRDCLYKTIRIVSDKNYELRFRFEVYEDPLEKLNRMLNSIKVPG